MHKQEIIQEMRSRYAGIVQTEAWGEEGLFYNPDGRLARGVYFATFKEKNGANDRASELDREGVYRVNFGISTGSFERHFGAVPARPPAGGVVAMNYDFTALSTLMPHPVYGWMAWVCFLSPSAKTYRELVPLMDEAYQLVQAKYVKRIKN